MKKREYTRVGVVELMGRTRAEGKRQSVSKDSSVHSDLNHFAILMNLTLDTLINYLLKLLSCVTTCNPISLKRKTRVIRELEAQLEYEREKREKLEAQMDKLRAQIHSLTLQLEDERDRHQTVVGTVSVFINYAKSSMVKYSNTGDILP